MNLSTSRTQRLQHNSERDQRNQRDQRKAHERPAEFSILFPSLFREGRALAFPCTADGQVVLDSLSERARHNYLFARAMVGKDYGWPRVQRRLFDAS
jgi:hypothetical protein